MRTRAKRPPLGHDRSGRLGLLFLLALVLVVSACSDEMFGDLGGASSDWIDEVATTVRSTTTTTPAVVHDAATINWVNDEFGAPEEESTPDGILATVFARSSDDSNFLQASRQEIAAVTADVQFPAVLPTDVAFVTSQLVIESRELRLADNPTVAFGLWSVEPYTRSRSVGQIAVLSVATDPQGVSLAATGETDQVCVFISGEDSVCSVETLGDREVFRLENTGVSHVWYGDPFRYELEGFAGEDEEVVHEVIVSSAALQDLLPAED